MSEKNTEFDGSRIKKEMIRFIKFGIVGLTNNLIYYAVYLLLLHMGIHYVIANIIGFTISVFNAYFWNNKYVFEADSARVWWKTFLKTYISYAGTGIVLSNLLLYVWIDMLGVSELIAPLLNLIITVPVNFLMNRFWAFKK